MVITRSQTNKYNLLTSETMSDNESEQSVLEVLSRAQMNEYDDGDLLNRKKDSENNNIKRRVSDMSRPIGEIINIVLPLTERISPDTREGNVLNTLSSEPNGRLGFVTESTNRHKICHQQRHQTRLKRKHQPPCSRPQQYTDEKCPRTSQPKPTGFPPEVQLHIGLPDMRIRRPLCKRSPIPDTQHISFWERAL